MQFTKFGQTGLTVSRMILGTGTFGKQTDEKEAHRMLDKAAEAGINFIDTADVYPEWATSFDSDTQAAAATRAKLFAEWADQPILVIGTHYAAPTAGHVKRDGAAFRFEV